MDDIKNLPKQIPQELENLQEEVQDLIDHECARPFTTYTKAVLATANDEFWSTRVVDYLVEGGFFNRSDFNGVKVYFANLLGRADGMVPTPNTILLDNSYKRASLDRLAPLFAHEMVRVLQIRRMGYKRFACRYSEYLVTLGNTAFYDRNPLEREAYALQERVEGIVSDGRVSIPNGVLFFYKDLARNGTFNWANNGQGQKIGTGWNSFKFVFGGEDGVIYAVKPNGDLMFYKDLARNGTSNWVNNGRGQKIGTGWNSFKFVFDGEDGVIRAVLP